MGTIATLLITWLTTATPVTYSVYPSVDGWAMPLPELVALKIRFQPEQISQTYVCEFAELSALNYRQLFLAYVERYQACFDLRQVQENEFSIRPNIRSGQMTEVADGSWQCKCAVR
jgi:hypothetical protein